MNCIGFGLILVLVECAQPSSLAVTAGAKFCDVYKPVYWSKDDTRKTKEQTDSNNRVWKDLCGKKK